MRTHRPIILEERRPACILWLDLDILCRLLRTPRIAEQKICERVAAITAIEIELAARWKEIREVECRGTLDFEACLDSVPASDPGERVKSFIVPLPVARSRHVGKTSITLRDIHVGKTAEILDGG